jgi:hypothetical protein
MQQGYKTNILHTRRLFVLSINVGKYVIFVLVSFIGCYNAPLRSRIIFIGQVTSMLSFLRHLNKHDHPRVTVSTGYLYVDICPSMEVIITGLAQ